MRPFSHIVVNVYDRAAACGKRPPYPLTWIKFASGDGFDWCQACVEATGLEHLRRPVAEPQLDLGGAA